MRRLLHDWVAAPLGIVGELYFGVPPTELARLARLEDAEPHPAEPAEHDSILAPWERQPRASMGNSPDFLQADVPSVGTFTARGIATVYAAILDGRLMPRTIWRSCQRSPSREPTRSSATPRG